MTRTILFHVSTRPEDIARALNSARILHAERPDARIRIIVNGPAIPGVHRDADPLDLVDYATVEACEGGMRAHHVTHDDLQPGIHTVPAAVVALSDAQFDGAAYIRI